MPFSPFILGKAKLSLAGTAYEGQIGGAVFTPNASQVSFTAINGDTHGFTTPSTWGLALTLAQDWNDATALARYLHENEGERVPAIFEPIDGGATITATVTITPGAMGATDTANAAQSTVTLGSTKPVLGAAIP
jgi:hypothetical protein